MKTIFEVILMIIMVLSFFGCVAEENKDSKQTLAALSIAAMIVFVLEVWML